VVRQRLIITNYYSWTMNEEKDIKVQINEYHKLLEDLKTENIFLPDEFVYELLIEKLSKSRTDYKQQLKHRHKQMSLPNLITHIIVEDTNRKESVAAWTKAMSAKTNTVQDKPFYKRYANKTDHNNKNKYKYNNPHAGLSNLIPRALASNPSFKKKRAYFVYGKPRHFVPQCRYRVMRNDNPPKPRANLVEGDDIIVAVISQVNVVTDVSK